MIPPEELMSGLLVHIRTSTPHARQGHFRRARGGRMVAVKPTIVMPAGQSDFFKMTSRWRILVDVRKHCDDILILPSLSWRVAMPNDAENDAEIEKALKAIFPTLHRRSKLGLSFRIDGNDRVTIRLLERFE